MLQICPRIRNHLTYKLDPATGKWTIRSNGDIFKNGSRIGNVTNMSDVRKVAIIYFFEFF